MLCEPRADVGGIPLIELSAPRQSDRFAVMITGDGGWRRVDRKVTDKLRAAGIPIVGFIASTYFRTERTPDESACALERVVRTYKLRWHKNKVILIGYSRGADALPFMVSRLPDDVRASVALIALLGLEPWIDFKYGRPLSSPREAVRRSSGDAKTSWRQRALRLRRQRKRHSVQATRSESVQDRRGAGRSSFCRPLCRCRRDDPQCGAVG